MKSYKITHTSKGVVADTGRDWFTPAGIGMLRHDILEHPLEPHPDPIADEFMAAGGRLAWESDYGHVAKVIWFVKGYGELPPLEPCPYRCPDERIVSAVRDEDQAEDIAGWIWRGSELFRERFSDRYRTVYRDLGGEIVRVVEEWRWDRGWKSSTAVLWVGEKGVWVAPHPVV